MSSAYLQKPITQKKTEMKSNNVIEYAVSDMQGWRNTMEDAHITHLDFDYNCHLFAVFDGHGGPEVAQFCKVHFVDELKKSYNWKYKRIELALKDTFLKMDEMLQTKEGAQELLKYAAQSEQCQQQNFQSYAGCTANVVLIYNNVIYCANSGDSRAILCNCDVAYELSVDHKPDQPEEILRIKKAGGELIDGRVNGNLNLSRSLGDLEYKLNKSLKSEEQLISYEPSLRIKKLTKDDKFILMGCDGIWEIRTNQENVDLVKNCMKQQTMNNSQIVEYLLDSCIAPDCQSGVGCDNMTCLLIKFKHQSMVN